MDRLKNGLNVVALTVSISMFGMVGNGLAQATGTTPAAGKSATQAAPATGQTTPAAKAPLQLQTLTPETHADPFPPVNPKFFTADTPSVATVESYLQTILGYDSNRIWRVVAIEKTPAPGVSKVVALISEKTANAKVQTAQFFVLPDGKHLIADASGVQPFGAKPYADSLATLRERADGPYRGVAAKDLMIVEFADLQCPACKDAQPTMKRLAEDFPKAHIVYQNLPLVDLHPFAFQAATYGYCVAQKGNDAFFLYAQAVYDTQATLTAETGVDTLKNAVVKAGLDPAAISTCAASEPAKASVNASMKLATDLDIAQTPRLVVNGRVLPLAGVPYETLKSVILYQAGLDGASGAAGGAGSLTLKPR